MILLHEIRLSTLSGLIMNLSLVGMHVLTKFHKREDITRTRFNLFLFTTTLSCIFLLFLLIVLGAFAWIFDENEIILLAIQWVSPFAMMFANVTSLFAVYLTNGDVLLS